MYIAEAAHHDYEEALKKQLEPESRKSLFIAVLQIRGRRKGEDWATLGKELKLLAEKPTPTSM